MKKNVLATLLTCCFLNAYAQDLAYFLPKGNFNYNETIPTPGQFFGYEIGEQHERLNLSMLLKCR